VPVFGSDPSGLLQLRRFLSAEVDRRFKVGIYSAAVRVQQEIVTSLIPNENPPPVDRGQYRAGWRVEKTEEGADVVNNTPQAIFIEDGVPNTSIKPGRLMIDALAAWAKRKGLVGKGKGGDSSEEAQSIAWAIAKSMMKKGIFVRGGKMGLGIAKRARELFPRFAAEEVTRELQR
jgi:hypothetical protein